MRRLNCRDKIWTPVSHQLWSRWLKAAEKTADGEGDSCTMKKSWIEDERALFPQRRFRESILVDPVQATLRRWSSGVNVIIHVKETKILPLMVKSGKRSEWEEVRGIIGHRHGMDRRPWLASYLALPHQEQLGSVCRGERLGRRSTLCSLQPSGIHEGALFHKPTLRPGCFAGLGRKI